MRVSFLSPLAVCLALKWWTNPHLPLRPFDVISNHGLRPLHRASSLTGGWTQSPVSFRADGQSSQITGESTVVESESCYVSRFSTCNWTTMDESAYNVNFLELDTSHKGGEEASRGSGFLSIMTSITLCVSWTRYLAVNLPKLLRAYVPVFELAAIRAVMNLRSPQPSLRLSRCTFVLQSHLAHYEFDISKSRMNPLFEPNLTKKSLFFLRVLSVAFPSLTRTFIYNISKLILLPLSCMMIV